MDSIEDLKLSHLIPLFYFKNELCEFENIHSEKNSELSGCKTTNFIIFLEGASKA